MDAAGFGTYTPTYEKKRSRSHTGGLSNSAAGINPHRAPTYRSIPRRTQRVSGMSRIVLSGEPAQCFIARSAYWITMNPLTRRKTLKVAPRPLPLSATESRKSKPSVQFGEEKVFPEHPFADSHLRRLRCSESMHRPSCVVSQCRATRAYLCDYRRNNGLAASTSVGASGKLFGVLALYSIAILISRYISHVISYYAG